MLLIGVTPGWGLLGLTPGPLPPPLTLPISPSGDVGLDTLVIAGALSVCAPLPRMRFHKLFDIAETRFESRFSLSAEVSAGESCFGGTSGEVSVVSEVLGDISDTSCSASVCCMYFCCCSRRRRSAASRSACCCLRIRSTVSMEILDSCDYG